MADVDAVIAALRIALQEAEARTQGWWKVAALNRWINQLPGAWWGRWNQLRCTEISTATYSGWIS